jgi:hypothetical protein
LKGCFCGGELVALRTEIVRFLSELGRCICSPDDLYAQVIKSGAVGGMSRDQFAIGLRELDEQGAVLSTVDTVILKIW